MPGSLLVYYGLSLGRAELIKTRHSLLMKEVDHGDGWREKEREPKHCRLGSVCGDLGPIERAESILVLPRQTRWGERERHRLFFLIQGRGPSSGREIDRKSVV